MSDVHDFKVKLKETVNSLSVELAKIRSGRASPALVENVVVECYGTKTVLKGLAGFTSLDARTVVVEPWDKGLVEAVLRAIVQANVGVQATADGNKVRVVWPQITGERRQEFVKLVSQKVEEARIKARRLRDGAVRDLQSEASEDIKFRKKEEIEKAMKENSRLLEELKEGKEKELLM